MKRTKIYKLLLALIVIPFIGTAQVRPDINSFSSAERTTLVNLMQQYITPQILQYHCDYVNQSGGAQTDIHSDFDFLPFHRLYIEGMEDFLIEQGYPQFVPLPSWDPATCTPIELQVVDPDCNSATCNDGNGPCTTPFNWCPNVSIPSYLQDLCQYNFSPTVPLGSDPFGLSRRLETPYHNSVHGIMSGVMGNFRSPAAPIFWLWHAYVDDLWKDWEENCPQSTTQAVDLYMKDNHFQILSERDRGEEPNIDNGPMWLSEDIWVRNKPDGLTNHTHENPEYAPGTPVYVYVRVRNRGYIPSLGSEQLNIYWAKASTSLSWPNNWNGSDLAPGIPAGNIIGTKIISIPIDAGDQQIIEFQWYPEDPATYNGINTEPWHFCLLARIDASNDPMAVVEVTDLNTNVINNNNIVWKNLSVLDNVKSLSGNNKSLLENIGAAVAVINPFGTSETFDITFSVPKEELSKAAVNETVTIDVFGVPTVIEINSSNFKSHGTPITEEGSVMIALAEPLYEKWKRGGKKGTGFKEIKSPNMSENAIINNNINTHSSLTISDKKLFEITGITANFENIRLNANEVSTTSLMVLYPESPVSNKDNFKYDIIQKVSSTGKVIGGVRYDIKKMDCTTKTVSAGSDRTITKGANTDLSALPELEGANQFWIDRNGAIISEDYVVNVSPRKTTTYTLKTVSAEGCMSSDQVTVSVTNKNDTTITNPYTLSFDGIDDYLETTTPVLDVIADGDFTFETWVNGDEALNGNHPAIMGNRPAGQQSNGEVFFFHNIWGGSIAKMLAVRLDDRNYVILNNGTYNGSLLDGTCHHIAITRAGSLLSFYADGVLFGTTTIVGNPNIATGENVRIGGDKVGGIPYKGTMGDLRVWNVARTASEILSNINASLIGNEPNLIANWEMNEGTGQIAIDKVAGADAQLGSASSIDNNDPAWSVTNCNEPLTQQNNQTFIINGSPIGDIINVSPNPAHLNMNVSYKIENTTNAQLRLVKIDNNSVDIAFDIDLKKNKLSIDVSEYPIGIYGIILICDGTVQDSEKVIIQ